MDPLPDPDPEPLLVVLEPDPVLVALDPELLLVELEDELLFPPQEHNDTSNAARSGSNTGVAGNPLDLEGEMEGKIIRARIENIDAVCKKRAVAVRKLMPELRASGRKWREQRLDLISQAQQNVLAKL